VIILLQIYLTFVKKIIPFFDKYPTLGVKAQSYAKFKKVAEIMKVKGHLTDSGLDEIRKIIAKDNSSIK